MRHLARRRRAFTLIELLVVIVILGILMAVAVPTFLRQQSKAQDSRTQQYLTTAFKAIRSGLPDTSNQYPASTTMVSWVQQSEPELTAQRGSCTTQVQTAPQDAVLVDPASSANALILCARSQSGNVYKLTATATGVQSLVDGTLVPLTLSGNEITDATRAAGTQGDGLSSDSSTGIWSSTTNLVTNGGFETNTTGWGSAGAPTIARDTSAAMFGTASLHLSYGGGANFIGAYTDAGGSVPSGTTITASFWVEGSGSFQPRFSGGSGTDGAPPTYTATSSWTRKTYTWTTTATGVPRLEIGSGWGTAAYDIHIDGVQIEQHGYASPYVETNGATATRGNAQVTVPASVLAEKQGWVAMRVRLDVPSTAVGLGVGLFGWNINSTPNSINLFMPQNFSGAIRFSGSRNGAPYHVDMTQTWSAGAFFTVIVSWTDTTFNVSLNGAGFSSTARPAAGGTAPPGTFGIGTSNGDNGGSNLDADFFWFACGAGTLSNADATTINSWGNADPKLVAFPAGAQTTMVWNGVSASGSLK